MNMGRNRRLSVLILEAHGAGSHARINHILQEYSRHDVKVIQTSPHHWRHQALTAHYHLANQLAGIETQWTPDVILFSGTFSIASLLALMPARFRAARRIAYFHESQWTYPAPEGDQRPFLIQHLDAVLLSDACWFNSAYHFQVFRTAVASLDQDKVPASTVEAASRHLDERARVVYPPIRMEHPLTNEPEGPSQRIIWNARWDYDKRAELFCAMLRYLAASGYTPDVTLLGTGGTAPATIQRDLPIPATIPGHLADRREYEERLPGGGIIVSTAAHEFFGVGVLEAVLAGATPVLPYDLAYPETLPSAWFYRAGNVEDLVRVVTAALAHGQKTNALHRSDAGRFLAERMVTVWDDGLDQIARP